MLFTINKDIRSKLDVFPLLAKGKISKKTYRLMNRRSTQEISRLIGHDSF